MDKIIKAAAQQQDEKDEFSPSLSRHTQTISINNNKHRYSLGKPSTISMLYSRYKCKCKVVGKYFPDLKLMRQGERELSMVVEGESAAEVDGAVACIREMMQNGVTINENAKTNTRKTYKIPAGCQTLVNNPEYLQFISLECFVECFVDDDLLCVVERREGGSRDRIFDWKNVDGLINDLFDAVRGH